MAAGALSPVQHGGAGGGAVRHSASTAAARRDSRGGPEPGGYSWAGAEALEPSRCVVRPRQPDPPGPVAPSEAQLRVSRTPAESPGSQSPAGGRCAVGRRRRCPHPRPDPGAGCRLRHSSLSPTPAYLQGLCPVPLVMCGLAQLPPTPATCPVSPCHLPAHHLCLLELCRVTGKSACDLILFGAHLLPGLSWAQCIIVFVDYKSSLESAKRCA